MDAQEMLFQVQELSQNAVAGYSLRAGVPYGTIESTEITERDVARIVAETGLALERLSQAVQILAEFIAHN